MAETNVEEFNLALGRYASLMEVAVEDLTKAVAVQALGDVVLGTRVDTGRARGNWQVAEGAPPASDPLDVYDTSGEGFDGGSARDAVSEGTAEILTKSGQEVIWLHNGVPYINVLEGMDKMVSGTVESLRIHFASKSLESWLGRSPYTGAP